MADKTMSRSDQLDACVDAMGGIKRRMDMLERKDATARTDPPVSEAQRRAMHAAAGGHSAEGISQEVGEEFSSADPGGRLPERKDAAVGQRVKILGGMKEFVGKTGRVVSKEGRTWRVKLDTPVEVPGVGLVEDDLWESRYLKATN